GSPNHFDHRSMSDGGKMLAMSFMQGVPELPAYDWERTRYVLSLGASLFESWCETIHFMRASSYLRRGLPGQRVKLVQVSPRFSTTAAKADEWVPIEPATYGALALGLAHVLVRDKLCDQAFLQDHTFGFEDWKDANGKQHRGFRDLLLKDYPPEKAASLSGVPVETIVRLAHEMAEHHPAIVLDDGGADAATNGLGTAMAIHALNALLGNLERPGGLLVQRTAPLAPWPAVQLDEVAALYRTTPRLDGAGGSACPLGRSSIQSLPEALLAGKPYPVKALILYKSNPVFSKPEGQRWIEALEKVPLVVSCSPLHDESTCWADLVLPDHTYLERWEIVEPAPSVGYPCTGLRQPVVPPLYNTLATGDLVIKLAQAVGAPTDKALAWKDYREACLERLKGLLALPLSPSLAREGVGRGGGSPAATELPELTKELQRTGGWWAPGVSYEQWETAFRTPSGKFEFYSQGIATRLAEVYPQSQLDEHLAATGVVTRGDDLCLPHWEPPRLAGTADKHPFILVPYRAIDYAEGGARQVPWLQELPLGGRQAWKEQIELNPVDAQRLGVRDGEWAWVESPAGQRRLRVCEHPGVRVGTASLPLGRGILPPLPSKQEVSGGYGILANLSDPLAGIFALQGTRVRIRKASTDESA
ncbi:MAG: molybdopterin-dependent oxidoreductase, partial [Planctomycetota bacterium]